MAEPTAEEIAAKAAADAAAKVAADEEAKAKEDEAFISFCTSFYMMRQTTECTHHPLQEHGINHRRSGRDG